MNGLDIFLSEQQKRDSEKFDFFKRRVKEEITDKNDSLKQIKDSWGKNPKPLEELIDSYNYKYSLDKRYDIPAYVQKQIKMIYNSIFSD